MRSWTESEIEFLKNYYPGNGSAFCAKTINRTRKAISSRAKLLKLKVNNRKILTEAEKQHIIKHYPHRRTIDIAKEIDISENTIYKYVAKIGLKKTSDFLSSPKSGRMLKGTSRGGKTKFKKGHVPANKGKKMPKDLKEKIKHTFFKKGHTPVNTLHNGAITIRKDKRGIPQKFIRIEKMKWLYLSNYVWEKHNGPVPKGYNVVFKDKNTLNCEIENLELISDADLMLRNSIQNYPEDLKKTIRALQTLNKNIKKYEKQN